MFYKIKWADINLQRQKAMPPVLINTFVGFFLTMLSIFSIKHIIQHSRSKWEENKKIWALIFFITGAVSIFIFKFFIFWFTKWMRQLVQLSEKQKHLDKIDSELEKNESFESKVEKMETFLSKDMNYDQKNIDSSMQLFHRIEQSERGYYFKILFYGESGTGKTEVIKKIASLRKGGGIIVNLSSLIQVGDVVQSDISAELERLNELFRYCKKNQAIIIFKNLEIFLQTRNYDFADIKNKADYEKKILKIIIGIWINYWLSILSSAKVTIVILSTSISATLDRANARRINDFFSLSLPNKTERLNLLKNNLNNFKIEKDFLEEIVEISENFSFRDMKNICEYIEQISDSYVDTNAVISYIKQIRLFKSWEISTQKASASDEVLKKIQNKKDV